MKWRERGFTITETVLFLAGSSALIMIAITAVGRRNRDVQFTDSMRGMHSFLLQRREYTRNGVAGASTTRCQYVSGGYDLSVATSDGSCLLLGYQINFSLSDPNDKTIEIRRIYGHRLSIDEEATCRAGSPSSVLETCFEPRMNTDPDEVYTIPWGTKFVASSRDPESTGFAFIRDPITGSVLTLSDITGAVDATGIEYCFKSADGANGKIIMGKAGSPEAIDVKIGGPDEDFCSAP